MTMKYSRCKKCGKLFAYYNWVPDKCPSCGGEVQES